MALDKNKLEYQIKVKADSKDLENLTKSTEKLRDATGKFATQEQVDLYNSLKKTRAELDAQAASGKDVSTEYDILNQKTEALSKSLGGLPTNSTFFDTAISATKTFTLSIGATALAMTAMNRDTIPNFISAIGSIKAASGDFGNLSKAVSVLGKDVSGISFDTVKGGVKAIASDTSILYSSVSSGGKILSDSFTKAQIAMENSRAAQLGFFATWSKGVKAFDGKGGLVQFLDGIYASLVALGKSAWTFASDLGKAFMNSGLMGWVKEFGTNLKMVFAESGVSGAASSFVKDSQKISVAGKTMKESLAFMPQAAKDFSSFGKTVASTHAGPSLIVAAEAAMVLNMGLVGLGAVLLNSDNAFVKFSGTLLLVGGILLGGFAYAVKMALGYVGGLVTAIGDSLINAMNEFEKKFQKAEVATTNFTFTLAGLNREFGESSGSVESWSKIVGELSDNTLIARTDAEMMAMEIASVGHGLGLTKTQMEDFIRVIPNYVKAGDNAFDVTVSFLQALGGAPQGVLKYAVHLSEARVEHSKFAKSMGMSMSSMSESEKVQARFNALMEQTAPILGRAEAQLNTVAGAHQMLGKSIDEVKIRMGSQNTLIAATNLAFAKLITTATYLPKPFWDFLGIVQDVLGVTLKLVGTFISWIFPIAAIVAIFKILSVAIAANITIQLILSKVLTIANVSLGGQAIAVTTLGTLWTGFATILKGIVITSLVSLGAMLKATALGVWALTTAMFANPLFWKAALIVGAVIGVYQAFKKIEEQTHVFSQALSTLVHPFKALIASFGSARTVGASFADAMGVILRKPIDLAVIAISALVAGLYTFAAAAAKVLDILTFGMFDVFSKSIDGALIKVNAMSGSMSTATQDLFSFSSVAKAQDPFYDITRGAKEAQEKLKGLSKELITATEKRLIFAQAEGKRAEVLVLSKQLAEERMALVKDAEEKKTLAKEILKIEAELQQFPKEALTEAQGSWAQLKIATLESLNDIASIRQAGALKAKEALRPLQEKIEEIDFLPKTADTQRAASELQKLMADTQSSINRETTKKIEDLKQSRLQSEIDTRLEIAKMRQDEVKQIELNAEKQIAAFVGGSKGKGITKQQVEEMTALVLSAKDKQIQELSAKNESERLAAVSTYAQMVNDQTLLAQAGYDKQLAEYKKMLDEKKISDEQYSQAKAKLEQQKAIGMAKGAGASTGDFGQEGVTQAISQVGSFVQGFSDMLLGPVAAVQGVVGIAQGIVDAIPNLLSSLTSLVTSLVELPTKILDGVLGLVQAVPRLISEFIPRLLEAVPDIVFSILNMLTTAIPDAFMLLLQRVPEVVSGIISRIPNMIMSLVTGLLTAVPKIVLSLINYLVNGVPAIIVALVKSIPVIINALIQGLVDGFMMIGDMIMSIFTGGSFFKDMGNSISESVGSSLKAVTGAAGRLFSVENLADGPVADAANTATKNLLSAGRTIKNWLGMAWEGMKQAGRWLDQNIWQPAWEGMKAAGRWMDDKIFQPIGDLGGKIWDGLVKAINAGGNMFSKLGTWIWDGLLGGIDAVGNMFSKLFKFDGGGMGVVEKFIGLDFPFMSFAQGGLVPGRSSVPGDSMKNDTVPALLSPGEVVLPRSVMGDEAFRRVVMAKLSGQEVPQFAWGGSVWGAVKSAASSVGGALSSGASAVGDVFSGAADFLIPDWITDLYKSINRFISGIDISTLITDPMGAIMGAIKRALDVFAPFFKQIIQPQGFATGGFVGTDTVPAMLTPGEFVINRGAVESLGLPTMHALNQGRLPTSGASGTGVQNVEINLTINTTQGVDAQTVKSRVLPVILEELRRASLEGRRVLSPAGVR